MHVEAENLSADLIWGVRAIGREIGRDERQAYHILATGRLPGARKVGRRWVVARSRLQAYFLSAAEEV
jgi:hypothetical protein